MLVTNGSLKTSPIGYTPMCSSHAYPTSTPLCGSLTGDRAAVAGPVTARGEDADISSKGLVPQLIDVLQALAEGQESLSRKVRNARLGYTCHTTHDVETYPQAEPLDFVAPSSFVRTNSSIEIRREPLTDNVELRPEPTSVNRVGNSPSPESNIGVSAASLGVRAPEVASPGNPPAPIVANTGRAADVSSEMSDGTDWLNSTRPGETTTAPLNRDYNFFDELDERLADLQDPAEQSGDW